MSRWIVAEMQFGTREEFGYLECPACGSLHIEKVPADLGRHYPSQYYAFTQTPAPTPTSTWARRTVSRWLVRSPDPLAKLIARQLRYRRFGFFEWARRTAANLDSKILDVGCGSGALLRRLRLFGFRHLNGVDPFTPHEVTEEGFKIRKCEISAVRDQFDVIMFNHVLEHVTDPVAAMAAAKEQLLPGGRILIRIPIAGSFAHREYGVNWVHWDAPRHLVIPSIRGFDAMAQRAGLIVVHRDFDGEEPSFLISASYQKNLPMAQAERPERSIRVKYRRQAHRLNDEGQGDFGVFVLKAQ